MLNKDINSVSPKLRDNLLMQTIGKYPMVTIPLIDPIGTSIDIYNSVPTLKNYIAPDGLLTYTNNTIQNDFYSAYRDLDSTIVDYVKQKNIYTKDYTYIDKTSEGIAQQTANVVLGYLLGDTVGMSITGNNNFNVSSTFEIGNTLEGEALGVALGTESKLGAIGLRSLGLSLANSVLNKTRQNDDLIKWIAKPLSYADAIDKLDTTKLNLSSGLSNIIGGVFPIYLFSDIKQDGGNSFNIYKNDLSWSNLSSGQYVFDVNNPGNVIDTSSIITNKQSLLYKTQQMFISGKINSLVTDYDNSGPKYTKGDAGIITKGRALKNKDGINYSRIWTSQNQYRNIKNLIRPFNSDTENTQTLENDLKRVRPGAQALKTYGVLQDDGFVKISPYKDFVQKNDVHKYMFSIENLAWKQQSGFLDSLIQGSSQDGPNGGRIMWFPPYEIKFTDQTNVNWNSDNFIGRGEPVYTYLNTERSGTLSFKVIVDHPSIINYYKQKDPSGVNIQDDDYLRLFAGVDVIDLENNTILNPTPPAPPVPVVQTKANTFTFKIYFPNNFSGVDYTDPRDVMNYLGKGEGCNWSGGNGYEILNGPWLGLNLENDAICQNNKFYYKVDSAYENQGLDLPASSPDIYANYKDTNANNLNSIVGSGDNYSFFELLSTLNYVDANNDSADQSILEVFKTINKIEINGCASNQGSDSQNITLSNNRAKTVENWLRKYMILYSPTIKSQNITSKGIYKTGPSDTNLTNSLEMKKERVVYVRLTTNPETIFNAPTGTTYALPVIQSTTTISSLATRAKVDMYSYSATNPVDGSNSKLYNDEAQFFEKLGGDKGGTGDFIFDKFSEKIKYFSPAFHSTTPEGFNSRLTFLHQCMRQGNTVNNAGVATNLSFGRSPICVLRIGDFYNTKVIFDNLNIDFEPLVWDLNVEGIGVQPMLANVNLSFKFIGGSDLTGPIARLQNAITFNFFANTGVYDDRNDRITSHDAITGDTYYPLYNPGVYDNQVIPSANQSPVVNTDKGTTFQPTYHSKLGYKYTVNTSGANKWVVVTDKNGNIIDQGVASSTLSVDSLLTQARINAKDIIQ